MILIVKKILIQGVKRMKMMKMIMICYFKIQQKSLKKEGLREQKELKVQWKFLARKTAIVKSVKKLVITQVHVYSIQIVKANLKSGLFFFWIMTFLYACLFFFCLFESHKQIVNIIKLNDLLD